MGFKEELNAIYDVTTGKRCYYASVRLLVHPFSTRLVYFSNQWKLHPNHLSIICAFFSLLCMYYFYNQQFVWAFFYFYIRTVFDYADGALARYAKKFSESGKVLDRIIDEIFYLAIWLLIVYRTASVGLGAYFLISVLVYRYTIDYFVEPRLPRLQGRRARLKQYFLDRGIILGCGVFTVIEFWSLFIFAVGLPRNYLIIPILLNNLDLIYRVYEVLKYAQPELKEGVL